MNSQAAEMLKILENLRNDNAKYKLKRRQNDLAQQLNPPTPLPSPPPQEQPLPIVIDSPGTSATSLTAAITIATTAEASSVSVSDAVSAPNPLPTATPDTIPTNHMPSIPASSSMSEPQDDLSMPSFDLQMLSPPSQFDNMNTGMSTEAIAPAADMNMMDDSLMSEENKLQDTMLDLGDIGNLGDNLGDMDDMINF
ncbi:hypothetical protein BGX28_004648 [Mortierella sp. GBA30]|nr:hypothetical protein BGX28_004648 [Mortierella sp. GBA30]